MGDKASAATVPRAGFGANNAHDLAVELEFHFRLRQQTRPLADFSRNGHLTLGRNAHGGLLTRTCKSKGLGIDLLGSVGWAPAGQIGHGQLIARWRATNDDNQQYGYAPFAHRPLRSLSISGTISGNAEAPEWPRQNHLLRRTARGWRARVSCGSRSMSARMMQASSAVLRLPYRIHRARPR